MSRHSIELSVNDNLPVKDINDHDPNSIGVPVSEQGVPTPYSQFTKIEKRLIVALITFAATFSPLSSFIFFPAINALSSSLQVSVEKINLTVTSYMIVAGIAPAVIGDMADTSGRRVAYLTTVGIYCAANVGLAVQNNWTALFLLRMLQSAGGAATIAMGYGVVSDIATPSERGGFVGQLLLGPNFATAIGPLLGGVLAAKPGWRWIFGVLAIASGTCVLLIALLLPETSRSIVGNGSKGVTGLRTAFILHLITGKKRKTPTATENSHTAGLDRGASRRCSRIPNPLASLKMLLASDTILITLIYGINYTNFSCLQASLSTLAIDIYRVSQLQAGLIYLPFGIGSCVGAYLSGPIMNHDYRVVARHCGITIDAVRGDDMTSFPIERSRFRTIWFHLGVTAIGTAGYGWSLQLKTHISVPLVIQFIIGATLAITFNFCGTLLVDIHPKSPAAAQAANNIVRCSLAGVGLAVLDLILRHLGVGWTFTLLAGLTAACLGIAWLEWRYGQAWRESLRAKGIER
ncbi:unnamed protein product [Periconia digitata]|uniref:Major facilitator superfamily (MFS) profile domain-containing protein n=1 Tax=Periconia digitata TaxID=1303443 RepID=A0A9W4XT46_9PLEO|nr:unnamed protein product [Periconia digitata]